MPVAIEHPHSSRPAPRGRAAGPARASLRIALVNNMPDAALADTEEQFTALLAAAAGERPVQLAFHYLPAVPRGPETRARLDHAYFSLAELFDRSYDGVILTGAEPLQPDLRAEAYWPELVELLRWAESHTHSAVLSCLAAHAAVLQESGIPRQPLARKRIGVFAEQVAQAHPLTRGARPTVYFPHSRWNELRQEDLAVHGYAILTHAPRAGTGLFVKPRGRSLFVHLQGHPEYHATTLLKEYRRDVRRFLRGERPDYPSLPHNYFDPESTRALAAFERQALARPDPALLAEFPDGPIAARLECKWAVDAVRLYQNWLDYLAARPMATTPALASAPMVGARSGASSPR
jgi:homoserine O-succinyltransferase